MADNNEEKKPPGDGDRKKPARRLPRAEYPKSGTLRGGRRPPSAASIGANELDVTQRTSNITRSRSADAVSELDVTQRTSNRSSSAEREVKPARAVSDGGEGRWADRSESTDLSKMAKSAAAIRGGTRATSRTGSGDLAPKIPGGDRSAAASSQAKDAAPKIPGANRGTFVTATAAAVPTGVAAAAPAPAGNLAAMTTASNAAQGTASQGATSQRAAKPKKKKKKGMRK